MFGYLGIGVGILDEGGTVEVPVPGDPLVDTYSTPSIIDLDFEVNSSMTDLFEDVEES